MEVEVPKGENGLVFPTATGRIARHNNLVRAFKKTVRTARLLDAARRNALRHFFASWCINPIDRGGQGLPPKVVQELLGHSSIVMTMDRYGHLFPRNDDADQKLAAAERALLS